MKKLSPAILIALLLVPTLAIAQGLMLPKDRSLKPLSIQYHRVETVIDNQTAATQIRQAFKNNTGRILEATYLFPVPEGATVADFAMTINGKTVRGEMLEKDKASRIYQDIVRRMQDPGLLQYMGENLFQARVFPIQPGASQKIEIVLHQIIGCDTGVCRYQYPLEAGKSAARTLEDFTLSVKIKSEQPVKSVYSLTHEIGVHRKNDYTASASLEKEKALLDRDFELVYTTSGKDVGLSVLSSKPKGEDGFFLLLVSPKVAVDTDVLPKDVTFVVDVSGSMAGKKMEYAKSALRFCLSSLSPKDRFNIVRFSDNVHRMSETLLYAGEDGVQQALAYVDEMKAMGGTAIDDALGTALARHEKPEGRPHMIIFLTDGRPTVGITDVDAITRNVLDRNKRNSKVFVFGIGDQVNTNLLDRLSLENSATTRYVKPGQEIETAISSFYAKVASPVMTDLNLSLGADIYDMYPSKLRDLFAGDQLVVLGRYKKPGERLVTLTGNYRGGKKSIRNEVDFTKNEDERKFIEKMWATRKVGYLLEQIRLHGEEKELVDTITKLGTTYGIVTPYTSYLIVEEGMAIPHEPPVPIVRPRGRPGILGGNADKIEADALSSMNGMSQSSGEKAVAASKSIGRMKEQKTMGHAPGYFVRHKAGKTFTMENGVWTDTKYEEGFQVLEITYLSDIYFDLLSLKPELAEVFSIGEKILVVTGNRKAILVSDEVEGTRDREKLKDFLSR